MKKEQIKEELIKRYRYIYENAFFILMPYGDLENVPRALLLELESFLLSDIPVLESKLYKDIEEKKKKKEYIKQTKDKRATFSKDACNRKSLDSKEVYSLLYDFIMEQSGDLKNKELKLQALDEYFRISRYTNDGKVWTSGVNINLIDMKNYSSCLTKIRKDRKIIRAKDDIGLTKSSFVTFVADRKNHHSDNLSILTEEEKQAIYLMYHDELPWNLKTTCHLEKESISLLVDARLARPPHTSPCGKSFYIKEKEIFVNPNSTIYRYFQICPYCGWIVNIPEEILSAGVKDRIEKYCASDMNLFRKMYLYSELFCLEKNSTENQKKLLYK